MTTCVTHFTVIQNGQTIGGFTVKELAVSTAAQHAVDTVKPVTIVAHIAAGGSSDTIAHFRNIRSGWTFTAKGIIQYIDGTIEWNHSSAGYFNDKEGY